MPCALQGHWRDLYLMSHSDVHLTRVALESCEISMNFAYVPTKEITHSRFLH